MTFVNDILIFLSFTTKRTFELIILGILVRFQLFVINNVINVINNDHFNNINDILTTFMNDIKDQISFEN